MFQNRENPIYSQSIPQTEQFSEGLRKHMMSIYNTMGIGLVLTGLTAFAVAHSPLIAFFMNPTASMIMFFALLAFMFIGFNPRRMWSSSTSSLRLTFYGFSIFLGAFFSTYVAIYTGQSIARVFFITATMFFGMSLWGYSTKKDLSSMGSFLIMGVWGLLIAIIVNIFLQSAMMHFIISAIGVVVYTGLTAFDTQNIKRLYASNQGSGVESKLAVFGALSLYMNFVLLFQFLMNFMGQQR